MEKYLAFDVNGLQFLDFLQFLNCSLNTLLSNMAKDRQLTKDGKSKFYHMRRLYSTDSEFNLLLRKGVYPYQYMDGVGRMSESCLPPQDQFFSHLTDGHIVDKDYVHAQKLWATFNMQNMKDYHDLYLKCDVVLLVDVSEEVRTMCLNYYKLDHKK